LSVLGLAATAVPLRGRPLPIFLTLFSVLLLPTPDDDAIEVATEVRLSDDAYEAKLSVRHLVIGDIGDSGASSDSTESIDEVLVLLTSHWSPLSIMRAIKVAIASRCEEVHWSRTARCRWRRMLIDVHSLNVDDDADTVGDRVTSREEVVSSGWG
jgi:hypothetical protein